MTIIQISTPYMAQANSNNKSHDTRFATMFCNFTPIVKENVHSQKTFSLFVFIFRDFKVILETEDMMEHLGPR